MKPHGKRRQWLMTTTDNQKYVSYIIQNHFNTFVELMLSRSLVDRHLDGEADQEKAEEGHEE
jgi:hypothetical protein